jgi:hypothetical protein
MRGMSGIQPCLLCKLSLERKEDLGENGPSFKFEKGCGGPPTRREGHVLALIALLRGTIAGFSDGKRLVKHLYSIGSV